MTADDSHQQTAANLTGRAKADAVRALRVLAETADSPAPDDGETPPLPDHLRDQWRETYGEATAADSGQSQRAGWLHRLARFLATPRAAWAGGLTAATALIVVIILQQEPPPSGDGGGVVTRGGSHAVVQNGKAAGLIVVGPADKTQALITQLERAFPARSIERVDSVPADVAANAIIIDSGSRTVQRAGRPAAQPLRTDPLSSPEAVISAIEELDEPKPR